MKNWWHNTVKKFRPVHLITAFILFTAASIAGLTSAANNRDDVTIAFSGDIIMHGPVRSCAFRNNNKTPLGASLNNGGFDHLFEKVAPIFKSSDMAVGNMEFCIYPPFISNGTTFNCRPEIIPALKTAGFTLLTVANNHILDQGIDGFRYAVRLLDSYVMPYVGAHVQQDRARAGHIVTINGIRIGFLAGTGVMNHEPPARGFNINDIYDEKSMSADIASMRSRADFTVLLAHFGSEYVSSPAKKDRELLRRYCDRGVDLVVGHHPHLLQGKERYTAKDGRLCQIFYSLGNFISNQTWENLGSVRKKEDLSPQDSIIVQCILSKEGNGITARYEIIPVYCVNRPDPNGASPFFRDIRPVIIKNEMTDSQSSEHAAFWTVRLKAISSVGL